MPLPSAGADGGQTRRCRYCQQPFTPSPFHPQQAVCTQRACQRRRQNDYHRQKIQRDPEYAQVCQDSRKKWRQAHPDYDRQYREAHPDSAERNRLQQRQRDQKRRLLHLAKNNLALDLRHCSAGVWLAGAGVADLAKNNFAPLRLFIFQPLEHRPAVAAPSCKEHPAGVCPGTAP